MFTDFQDTLIAHLQTEVATGRHLEGIDLVQFSDAPAPAQYHQVVKVDWDNRFKPIVQQSGLHFEATFAIGILTGSTKGEKEADRRLQDLLARWVGGKLVGLVPCLVNITGVDSDASGVSYSCEMQPEFLRRTLKKEASFRAGAYFTLKVTMHARVTDIL